MNIYTHIFDYLASDPILVGTQATPPLGPFSGLLTGGLWNRPLKRANPNEAIPSPGSTPAAFGDASEVGRIRYAASLVDHGDFPHIQELDIPTAFRMNIAIHIYAQAHESGKAQIRLIEERLFDLLHGYRFVTDNGPYARVFFTSRFGIVDSEEFVGAVTDYCRYDIVSRRREAA
jgi:hypothetical protein